MSDYGIGLCSKYSGSWIITLSCWKIVLLYLQRRLYEEPKDDASAQKHRAIGSSTRQTLNYLLLSTITISYLRISFQSFLIVYIISF